MRAMILPEDSPENLKGTPRYPMDDKIWPKLPAPSLQQEICELAMRYLLRGEPNAYG